MHRFLAVFTLTVMLTSQGASAQTVIRWKPISFGEPAIALDTASVTRSPDGFPRATLKMTYAAPRGGALKQIAMKKKLIDFDCSARQLRTLQSTGFAASGEVLDSLPETSVAPWVKVTSATHDEAELVNSFCRTTFAHR